MTDYNSDFTMSGCRLDNLDLEVKKITAVHNALLYRYKRHTNDDCWHNLRAFLINRIEQLSNYELIVTWDDDNYNPNFQIQDRKKYLKETYNFDWTPSRKSQ